MKRVVAYIFTFIALIFIIAFVACEIFKGTILSEEYTLSVLEKNNYYQKSKDRINDAFGNYILQSGLEPEILEGLITEESVKDDVQKVIKALYTKSDVKIRTDEIKNELNSRIDKILEENNKTPNKEERASIDKFVKSITDAYNVEIAYSISTVNQISGVIYDITKLVDIATVVSGIIVLVLIVFLLLICRKLNTSCVGVCFIASGILLFSLQVISTVYMNIQDILMFNADFSSIIRYMAQDIVGKFNVAGVVFILLGIGISMIKVFRNGHKSSANE